MGNLIFTNPTLYYTINYIPAMIIIFIWGIIVYRLIIAYDDYIGGRNEIKRFSKK